MTVTSEAIITAARDWLGTPYHHQASVKGAGCDCLGLIRGVWRALYGPEPEAMPPYTRDWGNATGSETLIGAACRHLTKLDNVREAAPGDVLVFRMRDGGVAKHAGIIVEGSYRRKPVSSDHNAAPAALDSGLRRNDGEGARMVHAQEGLGVVEIPLGHWWLRRAVAAFRFPDIPVLQFTSPRGGEVGAQRAPGEGVSDSRSPSPRPSPQRGEGDFCSGADM